MKTVVDVENKIYDIINVSSVLSLLTGHIWKHERPKGEDANLNFIVINSLPINSNYIQRCYANINIFCLKVNGADDTDSMASIFDAVMEALDNRTDDTMDVEYDTNHIIDDYDDPLYSYMNIKLEIFIEND